MKFFQLEIGERFRPAGLRTTWIKTGATAARVEHERTEVYMGPHEPVEPV